MIKELGIYFWISGLPCHSYVLLFYKYKPVVMMSSIICNGIIFHLFLDITVIGTDDPFNSETIVFHQ